MSGDEQFSRAGDVLKSFFDKLVPQEASGYNRFFSGWDQIAGEKMSFHVRPRDILNGDLILEADHPGWIQQVRMRQEGLLGAIRREYPELEIRRIRVTIQKKAAPRREIQPPEVEPPRKKAVPEDTEENPEAQAFFKLLETMKSRGES